MSKSQELAKLLESLARMSSSVDSGILTSSNSGILSLSVSEPVQSKSRDYLKFLNTSFALTSCKSSSFSTSRSLRLALQEGEKKEDLSWELWSSSRLLQVKDLKKIHSVLSLAAPFGKAAWNHDDKFVVYSAEAIQKKSSNFWSGEENSGNQNWYKENFGEGLKHVVEPQLFVYKVESNDVCLFKTPENVWPAQPVFRPGTNEVYFVGFEKFGFKLGLAAMINRKTKMFKGRVEDEGIEEVEGGSSYMGTLFPKFSPDGRFLTFYGVPIGSISHCMCVSLVIRDLNTGETRELVPRVFEFNSKFNGIYGFHEGLSTYNWIDNETIVFSSNHDASECLFSVNLSGDVQELVLPLEKPYLSTILDVFAGTVMVKASNFKTPDQVYLLNISNNLSPVLVESCLHQDLNPKENEIRARLDQIETTLIKSESSDLKSILYHKPGTKNLLAVLHGGPHSISFSGYALSTSLRSLQDMSILLINYSGSTGFGSNLLTTLLGKIGDLDVEDCIKSINQAKSLTGCSKVITFGGSHGGFLSTHLASRMELSGCVTINGALDVASMHLATDINDWGLAEVCASDLALPPSPEQYRAMYAASPVSRAGLITCPVLICAGSGDLRVPAFTSQEMFRVLKANQKDCQMLWYHDEGHGVLGKAASFDLIVNTTAWIMEKFENS